MRAREPRYRSARYLAWCHGHLLEQVCPLCRVRAPAALHHYDEPGHKALGAKCSDLRVVALCRECHAAWHQRGLEFLAQENLLVDREAVHRVMRAAVVASVLRYGRGLFLLAQERGAHKEVADVERLDDFGRGLVDVRVLVSAVEALEHAVFGGRR